MKLRVLCILLVKGNETVETALDVQTATPVIAMSLLIALPLIQTMIHLQEKL